ncbi:NGG1p interacting factor NIF3 [Candidatus Microgenomates bacterium]|nr:NGG1p interacting factor NIF3 [Candidatus Microgenomates bacterium]
MTIQEIYQLAIEMGIKADPRGKDGVKKALERVKKEYDELKDKEKEDFDRESLKNPYSDSRILFGDSSTVVDKVLMGIDIGTGEIVLADRLNEKGEGIDLVIAHHPQGQALAALDEVMDLQVEMMAVYGVPINVAEGIMKERIGEVYRKISSINHFRAIDSARLLNLPLMCLHTALDNLGWRFLTDCFKNKTPDRLGDVLEILKSIPEFEKASKTKTGPVLFVGDKKSRAGKVEIAAFTGGTEGAKAIYEKMAYAGIGTVIGMHASEEHRQKAKKHHLNLVITGHMASDSLGINLFLDELEKKGVTVLPCSGVIRVSRRR